jgi:hypothetical protein
MGFLCEVENGLQRGGAAPRATSSGNRKPASGAGSRRLRGKDSNLDYLIQSQASYH